MDNPLNKMIQDAQITSEIMQDALHECFEDDADPHVVFSTALQTILIAMFSSANDKQNAVKAAQHCITAAEIINEKQESTLH